MALICVEGRFDRGRIPVLSNAFDIPQRLKEIDPRYFVMFNTTSQKYEVHVKGQPDTTLGLTLPFDELDARALGYVQERNQEHFEAIARQIDIQNERLVQKREADSLDKAGYKTREAFLWDEHHPSQQGDFPKELVAE